MGTDKPSKDTIRKLYFRQILMKLFNACRITISLISAYFLSYIYAMTFNIELLAILNEYGSTVGFFSGLFLVAGIIDWFILREIAI